MYHCTFGNKLGLHHPALSAPTANSPTPHDAKTNLSHLRDRRSHISPKERKHNFLDLPSWPTFLGRRVSSFLLPILLTMTPLPSPDGPHIDWPCPASALNSDFSHFSGQVTKGPCQAKDSKGTTVSCPSVRAPSSKTHRNLTRWKAEQQCQKDTQQEKKKGLLPESPR